MLERAIIASVMNYLRQAKAVFQKGKIRFSTCDGLMSIAYHHEQEAISVSQQLEGNRAEIYRQMQDFFLDCFFHFEREGQELNATTLAKILGTNEDASRRMLSRIYSKLKIYEEQFL